MHRPTAELDVRRNIAILIAMSVGEQLPLAEVKNRLSEVVDEVETQHARVIITKHGRPAAVLMSAADLESLEETLRVLSDPDVMAQIRSSRLAVSSGETCGLTKEEALARIGIGF